MFGPLTMLQNVLLEQGILIVMVDKIELGRVDHQQGAVVIVEKILVVGVGQRLEIVGSDRFFIIIAAGFNPFREGVGIGLQVNHDVGFGKTGIEQAIDFVVELLFVGGQIDAGKNPVLGEGVVADNRLTEHIVLHQLLLLLIAIEQKKELGLEGIAFAVFVKIGQKGILIDRFKNGLAPQIFRKALDQRGFAGADGAVDGDIFGGRNRLIKI